MPTPVTVTWDALPLRQSFGRCNVVFDGVATNGLKSYRVNVTATTGGRKPEIVLRYLAPASKRGALVPDSAREGVRAFVLEQATRHLEAYRAAYIADCRARDAAPWDGRSATLQNEMALGVAPQVRRNNVEYHAGAAARRDGEALDACPYSTGGERATRWTLGWNETPAPHPLDAMRAALDSCDADLKALASTRGSNSVPAIERRDAMRAAVRSILEAQAPRLEALELIATHARALLDTMESPRTAKASAPWSALRDALGSL